MSAISASPGMTRMSEKTINDDSSRTGTASSRRRITYLYIARSRLPARRPPHRYLSIQARASVGEP